MRQPLRRKAPLTSARRLGRSRQRLRFGNAYTKAPYRAQVRRIHKRSGGICEARVRCGGSPVEGDPHHLRYNEQYVGPRRLEVPDEDLIDCCRPCHLWFERQKELGRPIAAAGVAFLEME